MSRAQTVCLCGLTLALVGLLGCTTQNPRTITKIDLDACVNGDLPWRPQDGGVIALWVDEKHATMSTLYGNDLAVEVARSADHAVYPAGAAIALVTWKQKEDLRWFGASVPAGVQSAEFVTVTTTSAHQSAYLYKRFSGNPLRQSQSEEISSPQGRVEYLLSQPAAIMP